MARSTQEKLSIDLEALRKRADTQRVADLRKRVREAMTYAPVEWKCPSHIDAIHMVEPLGVRKARAVALKLAHMSTDLWHGQLFAGSMTLETPHLHMEWGFPDYVTDEERQAAKQRYLSIYSVFGHIVPDYPSLLTKGLMGIRADAENEKTRAANAEEIAFLESVIVALEGVIAFAHRLADRCENEARKESDNARSTELYQMAANLRQSPAGPAQSFWQALQSVWLLHMIFHSTMDGNAMGRVDQYVWPYLQVDLETGRLTWEQAAELVDCFCLKFNERAQTTNEQRPEARSEEIIDDSKRTRHATSSQIGTHRDGVDATNHWLQNIVLGGLTPVGDDGTNPLSFLLLESYHRNKMTNPLLTVRTHRESPAELLSFVSEVLKDGGGMPAIFNDEALIPALQGLGIPEADAKDYTNDGCWEVIIPGRTDFRFQRVSLMLCLERALRQGRFGFDQTEFDLDTGDPQTFSSYEEVWQAFLAHLDATVERVVRNVVASVDDRSIIAPVPLLSALIDGAISSRRDMTAGGAKFRTYGVLAESAAHAIDSLTAIRTVVFEQKKATMDELCQAMEANFQGYEDLRKQLLDAPKYGNDDEAADDTGTAVINAFTAAVNKYAQQYRSQVKFACGVGTFSWYIGIGEGLAASADGRLLGDPVSSNFSPALGRDMSGIPAAILSYSKMCHEKLPAGGPLDLRISRKLVEGETGTARMVALIRGFIESGGAMMTLTVADIKELLAAQRDPDKYSSLRVRMGGWCAYFTMLSREQQDHHIHRQENSS